MHDVEPTNIHLVKVKDNCIVGEKVDQLPVAKTNGVV